jgi:uncharacterized membrane-anchored protein
MAVDQGWSLWRWEGAGRIRVEYRRERTLSIHSIDTTSREAFHWLAVLFTFALAAVGIAHFTLGLDAVWGFWIACILTRPLGVSIGDYLSQPTGDGGLGLGTVVTSVLFLAVNLGVHPRHGGESDDGPQRRHRPRSRRGTGRLNGVGGVQEAFRN